MRLREYYTYCTDNNKSMLPLEYVPVEYMADYKDYYPLYDTRTMLMYGERILISDDISTIEKMLELSLKTNLYAIKTLYGTTIQKYSPIENTEKFEDVTVSYEGSEDYVKNNSNTTEKNGTHTTERNGNIKNTEKVTAFDSVAQQPNSETDTDYTNLTDTETFSNFGDTSISESNESKSFTNRKDKTTIHTHGNIGVTSNQQMLKEERQIALFNFYDAVMEIIFLYICELYYESEV